MPGTAELTPDTLMAAQQPPPDAPGAAAGGDDEGLYVNPNTPKPRGMVQQGNIDLRKLPVIDNGDGSYSTVYSTSFTDEKPDSPTFGKDVLVRGILNGKRVDDLESEDKAKRAAANDAVRREYYKTGKHLGVFQPGTDEEYRSQQDPATLYGGALHNDFAAGKIPGFPVTPQKPAQAPPQKPSDTLPDPAAAVQIATALGRHIAEIATRPPTPPPAPTPPRVEAGMPAKSPYDLLPDAGTPTAQSRWTRTPIYYGQTRDVPESDAGYSDYDANKGKGQISVNAGSASPASPVAQSITRHESVHMLLDQTFKEPGTDYRKLQNDPAVKLYTNRIAKILHDYGYKGESETEIPAYMAVFSNQPTEWTKNVPLDLRNKYIAAFTKALAKQDPKAAAKYFRMSAGARTGEGPSLNPKDQPAAPAPTAAPPPGVPPAPLPLGLRTRANSPEIAAEADELGRQIFGRTPAERRRRGFEAALNLDPTGIVPGTVHAVKGVAGAAVPAARLVSHGTVPAAVRIATGSDDARKLAAGVHQAVGGAMEASTSFLPGQIEKAPAKTLLTLAAGMVTQEAVARGLKKLGIPEEYADVVGDLAGFFAGAATHKFSARSEQAIKKKYETILKARDEQRRATANTTGSEPYRPPAGEPELNPDTFMQQQHEAAGEELHENRKKPATRKPPRKRESREPARSEPAVGARGGGEHERSTSVEPRARAEPAAAPKEVTAGGPDIKLNEFHANRGGFASAARLVLTSPKKLTSEDIENNFFKGHDISVTKVRPSIFTSQGHPDTQLFDVQFHAPDGAAISAPEGIEESLGLKPGERYIDRPVTGIPKAKPTAAPAQQPLPAIEFGGNEVEPGNVEQFIHNASTPDLLKMRDQATDTYNTPLGHAVDDEIQRRVGDMNPRRVAFVGDGWIVRGSEELGKYPTQGAALQALIDEHGGVKTVTAAPGVLERLGAAGAEADQWLREQGYTGGGRLSANAFTDPEFIRHMAISVAGTMSRGALTFAEFSRNLVAVYGPRIKPALKQIWDAAQSVTEKEHRGAFWHPELPLKDIDSRKIKVPKVGKRLAVPDVSRYLDVQTRNALGSIPASASEAEKLERLMHLGRAEMIDQLKKKDSGAFWYTKDTRKADRHMAAAFPELRATVARGFQKAISAVMSNNSTPSTEAYNAARIYEGYRKADRLPMKQPNRRHWPAQGAKLQLTKIQKMLDAFRTDADPTGVRGVYRFLSNPQTGRAIRVFRPSAQIRMADIASGAMALGPKIGRYWLDLMGRFHPGSTVDKWDARAQYRRLGRLSLGRPMLKKGSIRESPSPESERPLFMQMHANLAKEFGLPRASSAQSVLWHYEQDLYRRLGLTVQSTSRSQGTMRYLEKKGISYVTKQSDRGRDAESVRGDREGRSARPGREADARGAAAPRGETNERTTSRAGRLARIAEAGRESRRILRQKGIIGGTSPSAFRVFDPEAVFHLTRSIAGDVAQGIISLRAAAIGAHARLREWFGDRLPLSLADVEAQIRQHVHGLETAGGVAGETGERGPVYREFRHDEAGATAALEKGQSGEAIGALQEKKFGYGDVDLVWGYAGDSAPEWEKGFGLAHILAKHPYMRGHLQGMLDRMTAAKPQGERVMLSNDVGEHATLALTWFGKKKTWLLTEYDQSPPASGNILFGSENPVAGAGEPGSPPAGSSTSSVEGEAPQDNQTDTTDRGPTYMGSGFGALEPIFRESKAEGDRLRNARNDALAAAKAAEAAPEQMKAGEAIRAYFTSERDLWAARTNQIIDRITRIVLPKIQDREALGIAREYRHNRLELQSWIDGTHPFLDEVDGGPAQADKNLAPLMPVLKQAMRILSKPTARERAADAAFTAIAKRDLQEGRAGGWLESRWESDEYVPHALNPAGEGKVAKIPDTKGRAMGGRVGKYFGFGERRSDRYPTMVHAVADGIIPKTLDPSALFIVHADQFARARATHLLEAHLVDSGLGKWGDVSSAPDGWVQLAGHTEEFKKRQAYAVPNSFDPETRESELQIGTLGLYVPEFVAKALKPITDPDYTPQMFPGFARLRTMQRGLKEAILGMSFFHLLTENFMAFADVGPRGMLKAFQPERESPEFLANERDLIASGGTTSIQGSTMDAYRGLRPGTIPTRAEVIRAYIPGSKQALAVADMITRLTFDNIQRRFKVGSFALHRDAWIRDNPGASQARLDEAKKGIASYINGVYGGLHWENMGISRAMVEVSRALFLAPDWSGSNLALAKYAAGDRVSPRELQLRGRLAGAGTKESTQARLARAFWTKQLLGGLIATQMLSLLFSHKFSQRPFQVYMGKDPEGKDVYQNVAFRGSIGDAVNLFGKAEEHAQEGYDASGMMGIFAGILLGMGVFVQGKTAPATKLAMHTLTARDDRGKPITPGGMLGDVLPIPIIAQGAQKTMFGDESSKYLWSERIMGLFGSPGQHVRHFEGPGEELAYKLASARGRALEQTAEDRARTKLRESLTRSLKEGKPAPAEVVEAERAGKLSKNDIREAFKHVRETGLQRSFDNLGIDDAVRVYSKANKAEKRQLQPLFMKKAQDALKSEPPADRAGTLEKVRAALAGGQ